MVGTEKQSEELVRYLLEEFENDPQQIWSTNFFGKSLHDMVREGLSNKLMRMPGGCTAEGAGDADPHYQRRQRRHDLHPAVTGLPGGMARSASAGIFAVSVMLVKIDISHVSA